MNQRFKLNYVVIPFITIIVASLGTYFASQGMNWYMTMLHLPSYTPPRIIFPIVWNIIYVLMTIAALYVWNRMDHMVHFGRIIKLFLANAALNISWGYLFFYKHWLTLATINTLLTLATVGALVYYIGLYKTRIAFLIMPYLAWISFAAVLMVHILFLNW